MRRRILTTSLCLGLLLAMLFTAAVRGHSDDPKFLFRLPPFDGPSYQAGQGAAASTTFPADNVRMLAWFPLNTIPGAPASANDCWGYVSPGGREYALIGLSNGTGVFEVTVPASTALVDVVAGPDSFLRDVKTYDEYAYVVSEGGGGIQVIDLTLIDSGGVSLAATIDGTVPSSTHNVAIDTDSGFLYRCGGGDRGLRIYDLANPALPVLAGSWDDRYVHDAQVVTFSAGPLAGREIAYCCTGFDEGFTDTGITILDVTDKGDIQVLDQLGYASSVYSHQGWLSADRQYFFHGDELDEEGLGVPTTTRVFNVADPENVFLAATYVGGSTAGGHNMYTVGTRLYQANFRSGLRVLDVSNPLAPAEIGFFDTWPDDDDSDLNSLWSCYADFPSGTIVGSDIEKGLFVWRFGSALTVKLRGQPPMAVDPDGDRMRLRLNESEGAQFVSGNLYYDTGSGFVSEPIVEVFDGEGEVTFPVTTCEDEIRYYLEVVSDDGLVVLDPPGAPSECYTTISANVLETRFIDDMESSTGWIIGDVADTATSGVWERVDPNGTGAQPENDHTTPAANRCWVTGQADRGMPPDFNDVDGGTTTLVSPLFDLTGLDEPRISFYLWFSNDTGPAPNEDTVAVEVSKDDGATWVRAERIGPHGDEANGGWKQYIFDPSVHVNITDTMRVRFIASDLFSDSTVEAGIDDVHAFGVRCEAVDAISFCGVGAVDAGCSSTPAQVLTVNGITAEPDRRLTVLESTPLTFSISEAPGEIGDGNTSKCVIYLWSGAPKASDMTPVPGGLGSMCFGPKLVATLPAVYTWNSIGATTKLGADDAPGPPPVIPDGATLDFLNLGSGAGRSLTVTAQGLVFDACSQGIKPFSVTNGVVVDVQ